MHATLVPLLPVSVHTVEYLQIRLAKKCSNIPDLYVYKTLYFIIPT